MWAWRSRRRPSPSPARPSAVSHPLLRQATASRRAPCRRRRYPRSRSSGRARDPRGGPAAWGPFMSAPSVTRALRCVSSARLSTRLRIRAPGSGLVRSQPQVVLEQVQPILHGGYHRSRRLRSGRCSSSAARATCPSRPCCLAGRQVRQGRPAPLRQPRGQQESRRPVQSVSTIEMRSSRLLWFALVIDASAGRKE